MLAELKMKNKYYFKRIINDKIKLCLILILFMIMVCDLLPQLKELVYAEYAKMADFNTFLCNNMNTSFLQIITWFLPVFLMLISSDDIMEDYITGYRNVLIAKCGRKKYVCDNILKGFFISFFFIMAALIFNFILAHIIYRGAVNVPMIDYLDDFAQNKLFVFSLNNPTVTYIMYILAFSFLSGLIGSAGASLALCIHKRKFAYPVAFFIWFVLINLPNSIIVALQPFVEYDLRYVLTAYIASVVVYLIVTVGGYVKELRYAQI